MELYLYLNIVRRRWPIVAAGPLLVALISLMAALAQQPRYGATARLLVTRPGATTVDAEDTLAYDLPAIVGGRPFAADVVAALARRGRPLDQALVEQALHAENQRHVVYLSATAADPANAVAIVQAAVDLVRANGLRYWGDLNATPERPGISVAVLDFPAEAALLNGPRAIAFEVALRALLGLIVGVGAAFALYYLGEGRSAANRPFATSVPEYIEGQGRPLTADDRRPEPALERSEGTDDRWMPRRSSEQASAGDELDTQHVTQNTQ